MLRSYLYFLHSLGGSREIKLIVAFIYKVVSVNRDIVL